MPRHQETMKGATNRDMLRGGVNSL